MDVVRAACGSNILFRSSITFLFFTVFYVVLSRYFYTCMFGGVLALRWIFRYSAEALFRELVFIFSS